MSQELAKKGLIKAYTKYAVAHEAYLKKRKAPNEKPNKGKTIPRNENKKLVLG